MPIFQELLSSSFLTYAKNSYSSSIKDCNFQYRMRKFFVCKYNICNLSIYMKQHIYYNAPLQFIFEVTCYFHHPKQVVKLRSSSRNFDNYNQGKLGRGASRNPPGKSLLIGAFLVFFVIVASNISFFSWKLLDFHVQNSKNSQIRSKTRTDLSLS